MKEIRIDEAARFIREQGLNIYDLAVADEDGEAYWMLQPASALLPGYSVTKLFIVTMIGILYDRGEIGLEDKLTELLHEELSFPYNPVWDAVTVRHALTHRMGLTEGVLDMDRDDTSSYRTQDFLKLIFDCPPKKQPGSIREYTDVPHYLLSRVIEKKCGMRADEAITEFLLNPMGFSVTAWARCPGNHTIGSSGSFMTAKDMVKLALLYRDQGVFGGRRIVSEEWVHLAEKEEYDLYPLGGGFYGKGGLYGQMTMFSREKGIAAAWHAHEEGSGSDRLVRWFREH